MEEKRPDPDSLIEKIKQDEESNAGNKKKGKLKIFLGYCAGVGKTYRMLQEASLKKKNDNDVVIGIVETHNRKETEALLWGLEIIPRKKIEYSGLALEEMDTDAVLNRHPSVVIVDELAHTNIPGSRHNKRFQDVEELINAGIDVFTTLNIQHIESLNDVIQQISGIKVNERVRDRIIESAAEVELVDLTPEKLLDRLKEGKVYIPPKAEQAMHKFFRKGNLLALRELSLKYTAKQVDEDIRSFMKKNAVPSPWAVGSRILVGISASYTTERLLRFTHRMAQDMDVEWFAVYVESPQKIDESKAARIQLEKNIRLAEELGAKVVLLSGANMADEMLNFSKSKNVTLIIVGPSKRTHFERLIKGSVVDELVSKSGGINILITGERKYESPVYARYITSSKRDYRTYFLSLVIILTVTAIGWLLRFKIEPINIGMLLLLPSIASGILWGIRVGLFASIVAVCCFDFFFITPYLSFRVSDLRYLPSFMVFILVSAAVSFLAKSIRQETESSRNRERFVYSLYSFSRDIIAAKDLGDILNRAVKHIAEAFESDVIILLPDNSGKLSAKSRSNENVPLSEMELAVATWSYNNGKPAGKGTDTLSSSGIYCLPLKIQDKTIGIIGLKMVNAGRFLTPEQEQLFESFASIAALAIIKSLI